MKHITTFENFLNENIKVTLGDNKETALIPGDKLKATNFGKSKMIEIDPTLKNVVDAPFVFKKLDTSSGGLIVSTNSGVEWIFNADMFVKWR
jgi:phage pi2 protein 07